MAGLVIGFIVSILLGIVLYILSQRVETPRDLDDALYILGIISGVIGFVILLIIPFFHYELKSAEQKAKVLNREYGTEYTAEEIFYAEDVIDTIRQIDRTRFELQGLENLDLGE